MKDDGDISGSDEEIYVYAEFDDNVDVDKYLSIHAIGFESKNPVIQLDDTVFIGKYRHPTGTLMFFDEDPSARSNDPVFDKVRAKPLKLLCQTRKTLVMEHGYLTAKTKKGDPKNPLQELQESDTIEEIKFSSIQEAIEKFKSCWQPDDPKNNDNVVVGLHRQSDIIDEDVISANMEVNDS